MRRHLTFANVASGLALTLVLTGGVAVAAGLAKNSVGSAQVKPNSLKSSDIKDASLKGVKSAKKVDTVQETRSVTAAVGAIPTTVATRGPFTITLRCFDGGGGKTRSALEIRTSQDNASYVSGVDEYPDLDVFTGPQFLAETNDVGPRLSQATFTAIAPNGEMFHGIGYTSQLLHGSTGCAAQLTLIG